MTKKEKKGFSRRKFLRGGAIVLGGTMVAGYAARGPIRRFLAHTIENLDVPSIISTYRPDFWFEVLPDNSIALRSPKVEMGQGIFTGFAMLAAEELEVALEQLRVEHANTSDGPVDQVNTGGSNSTSSLFVSIREVAATMREMLKLAAARQWNLPVEELRVENGVIIAGERRASYAEIAHTTSEWKIPKTPKLKPVSAFKYVGKEVARVDLRPKVMGEPLFGIDQHLPDMAYAAVLQSPYIGGVLRSVDTRAAAATPGVLDIVELPELLAVVAENRHAAEIGLSKIEAEWDIPKVWQQAEVESLVRVGNGRPVNVQKTGRPHHLLKNNAERVFTREYRTPMAVHAHLEPNGAVALAEENQARVFIGTQAPGLVNQQVAKALRLKKKQVTIEVPYLGGGFGRRVHLNNAAQAALISRAVGKPVHLFQTREQEFLNAHYRPNTHHTLRALLGPDGAVEVLTHDQATPDIAIESAAGGAGLFVAGADFISAGHGAPPVYQVKHKSASVWHCEHPLRTGIWRSVGLFPNTFAIESFMNELAHAAGKDPIALRLKLLAGEDHTQRRFHDVLETLREKSEWGTPLGEGRGRGMALAYDRRTIVAAAAEVRVANGHIQVTKVTHVTDAGLRVNPEGIRMQVEGCIMMGISSALYEELRIKDGQIEQTNFHAYPMAGLKDTPEMEIILLEGDDKPYGVAEPPIGPIAPAIGAAIFEATGKWLRSLPFRLV
jgi:isoquinoline 1-oxidoreductase beta subunit